MRLLSAISCWISFHKQIPIALFLSSTQQLFIAQRLLVLVFMLCLLSWPTTNVMSGLVPNARYMSFPTAKILVGDPESSPQRQKIPLSMR